VSFSDPDVAKLLKKRYVCAWLNTNGETNAGSSFAHTPNSPAGHCIRGNGEHNVQLLVLTPRGRILHALSGYVPPATLIDELRFAADLFASLSQPGRRPDTERVAAALQERIDAAEQRRFTGPLASWAKRRTLSDYRFVAKRPLLEIEKFRSEDFVGRSKTFFGSSTGTRGGETIGDAPQDLLDKIRTFRGGQKPTKPAPRGKSPDRKDADPQNADPEPEKGARAVATAKS